MASSVKTIDEYISAYDGELKERMTALRALIHSLSVMKKVERSIHVGAVVGAHGKGGQVVQVVFSGRV